jgi:single-strand DNA-binding protein
MFDMNSVSLTGRVTRDAKIGNVGETPLAEFSIAVSKQVKKDGQWAKGASFFDIKLWGKAVENIGKYLTKGARIGVEGEIDQETWTKDGKNNSAVKIRAKNVVLLGSKNETAPNDNADIPF